jgi:hypothetical protein
MAAAVKQLPGTRLRARQGADSVYAARSVAELFHSFREGAFKLRGKHRDYSLRSGRWAAHSRLSLGESIAVEELSVTVMVDWSVIVLQGHYFVEPTTWPAAGSQ